jgi:hypothetical protein
VNAENYPCDATFQFTDETEVVNVTDLPAEVLDVFITASNTDQVYRQILDNEDVAVLRVDMSVSIEDEEDDDLAVALVGTVLALILV